MTDVLSNPIRQPDGMQMQCLRSSKSGGRLLAQAREQSQRRGDTREPPPPPDDDDDDDTFGECLFTRVQ